MPRGSHSIEIQASTSKVFDLIHDYDLRLTWDSMLKQATLLDGATMAATGVRSRCVGNWKCFWLPMETKYVSFTSGSVAAVKLVNRPWFFDDFAATIRHENIESTNRSRTTYIYSFRAKPKWLRPILEPLMKLAMNREVKNRLAALKRHLEPVSYTHLTLPTKA